MNRLRYVVPMVTAVLVAMFAGTPKSPPQPEPDYVVPANVDVVQVCQHLLSTKRAADKECDGASREGYRWMYDKRAGHLELPVVGEVVYTNEFSADRPLGLTIERIPDRGGWWERCC